MYRLTRCRRPVGDQSRRSAFSAWGSRVLPEDDTRPQDSGLADALDGVPSVAGEDAGPGSRPRPPLATCSRGLSPPRGLGEGPAAATAAGRGSAGSGYSPNPKLNVRTEVMANCTSGATNPSPLRVPVPDAGTDPREGEEPPAATVEGVVAAGDRPQEHVGHARVRGAEAALGADPHDVVVVVLVVVERRREDVAGVEPPVPQMFLRQVTAIPAWG